MSGPVFFQSHNEELKGSACIRGMKYYSHHDIQGTEPSVDALLAPPKGLIAIYRANKEIASETNLSRLGEEARDILDQSLPNKGAVLLRGIPARTAEEFSAFWHGCKHGSKSESWEEAEYVNFGRPRKKEGGVDTATNIPSELTLNLHNETSYNPIRPSRIGLYCIQQSSSGGESTIARNEDVTKRVPQELIQYIQDHGGVMYERCYPDARGRTADANGGNKDALSKQLAVSWQEKCGVDNRADAERFWLKHGFQQENLLWETDGTLRVRNIESGFVEDPATGKLHWFNNLDTVGECADGSGRPPARLLKQYQADRWQEVYAWRLEPGDWLVLDNLKVQHGRLPYPDGEERRLLTILTK